MNFYVPERRLVVFLHAHPVLPALSRCFFWAARKLGPWTFLFIACAVGFLARYLMLIVYPQHGMWILGGFAICRLPEFALGMALGMWHSRSTARAEWFFLGGAGLVDRIAALSGGAPALPQWLHLHFRRLRHRRLLPSRHRWVWPESSPDSPARPKFSAWSEHSPTAFYLIHQPYVIWLGLRIREQPIWMFLLIAAATLAVLSAGESFLERDDQRAPRQTHPGEEKGVTVESSSSIAQ